MEQTVPCLPSFSLLVCLPCLSVHVEETVTPALTPRPSDLSVRWQLQESQCQPPVPGRSFTHTWSHVPLRSIQSWPQTGPRVRPSPFAGGIYREGTRKGAATQSILWFFKAPPPHTHTTGPVLVDLLLSLRTDDSAGRFWSRLSPNTCPVLDETSCEFLEEIEAPICTHHMSTSSICKRRQTEPNPGTSLLLVIW